MFILRINQYFFHLTRFKIPEPCTQQRLRIVHTIFGSRSRSIMSSCSYYQVAFQYRLSKKLLAFQKANKEKYTNENLLTIFQITFLMDNYYYFNIDSNQNNIMKNILLKYNNRRLLSQQNLKFYHNWEPFVSFSY